jgi:hypothetical protein
MKFLQICMSACFLPINSEYRKANEGTFLIPADSSHPPTVQKRSINLSCYGPSYLFAHMCVNKIVTYVADRGQVEEYSSVIWHHVIRYIRVEFSDINAFTLIIIIVTLMMEAKSFSETLIRVYHVPYCTEWYAAREKFSEVYSSRRKF